MTLWTDLKMKCLSLNHYRTDPEDRTTYDISYESLYLRLSDDISHITMIFDDKKNVPGKPISPLLLLLCLAPVFKK